MRLRLSGHESARPVVLATVALLGLALVLCLIHIDDDEAGVDMVHGACGIALVASFYATGMFLASLSWWRLADPAGLPYAVPLHLPDPPPKSSGLL